MHPNVLPLTQGNFSPHLTAQHGLCPALLMAEFPGAQGIKQARNLLITEDTQGGTLNPRTSTEPLQHTLVKTITIQPNQRENHSKEKTNSFLCYSCKSEPCYEAARFTPGYLCSLLNTRRLFAYHPNSVGLLKSSTFLKWFQIHHLSSLSEDTGSKLFQPNPPRSSASVQTPKAPMCKELGLPCLAPPAPASSPQHLNGSPSNTPKSLL